MKDALKYKGFIGSAHFAAEDREFYGKVEGVNDPNYTRKLHITLP